MRNNHKIIAQEIRLPFKMKLPGLKPGVSEAEYLSGHNSSVPLRARISGRESIKKAVLALGAQAKNTLCFAEGETAYISRAHPDLSTPEDLSNFEKDVRFFLKRNPRIIACDLHPDYASTKYASALSATNNGGHSSPLTLHPIQHHHAHIASCMAENGLKNQRVIGVAFDGTGLGSDNTLWGAEFMICDYNNFQRSAHLRDIPLLGGEAAVREPWRVAAAWLYTAYPREFARLGIGFIRGLDKNKWSVLKKMYASGFNSMLASSMGRLFDAAASIILEDHQAHGEAELAIKLEKMAGTAGAQGKAYHFNIVENRHSVIVLDPLPIFKQIVSDIESGVAQEDIAYRFHLTVVEMMRKTCLILRRKHKINRVALSGGVFQNSLLLRLGSALLYKEGFEVFTHKKISCNDAGISLGQAVIAAHYSRGHFPRGSPFCAALRKVSPARKI